MPEAPLRRATRGFTLVELLVVISMIALLVALLLPSLRVAMREAAKANCLTRVRGLGQSSIMFAMDNALQLPAPIPNYDTGGRTMLKYQYCAQDMTGRLYDWSGRFFMPSGTLAFRGYVQDPKNFFCPTFLRTTAVDNNWDSPSSTNTIWRSITSGGTLPTWSAFAGYSEHFYAYADNQEMDAGAGTYAKVGSTRLDYVELYWNRRPSWGQRATAATRGWYSPVFYTCAAWNKGGGGRPNIDVSGNCHIGNDGTSLAREGCNAVFFDGSARWISRAEFYRLAGTTVGGDIGSPADWISFHYPLFGSGHSWMRNYATLVKPN